MKKDKAIGNLRQRLIELEDLTSTQGQPFDAWKAKTLADFRNLFPRSEYPDRLTAIWYPRHMGGPGGAREAVLRQDFENQKCDSAGLLEGAIHEIAEYWEDSPSPHSVSVSGDAAKTRRVFVVHGHDDAMRLEVVRTLEKLELEPVVLFDRASEGRTIIEKFESDADVGYAVVLYSPDDVCLDEEGQERRQPRQNVVLEHGYFIGALGRAKVTTLVRAAETMEMPSDVLGVVYIRFEPEGNWALKLARELVAAGFDVDVKRLL